MSSAIVERLPVTRSDRLLSNRATGRISLSLDAKGGITQRTSVHEAGSLRVRFPTAAPDMLEAVLINTAGGMTGGDDFSISLSLDAGAQLLAGTAAAEKIYRSTGADSTAGGAVGRFRNMPSMRSVTTYPPTTFMPAKAAAMKPRM